MSHVVKNDQVVKTDPLSGQQLPPLFFFSHQQHSQLGFRRMAKTLHFTTTTDRAAVESNL